MRKYILLLLILISGCTEKPLASVERKTLAFAYNFRAHPEWQDIIIKYKDKYNLVFHDHNSIAGTRKWLKQHKMSAKVYSDRDLPAKNVFNISKLRKQLLRERLPKNTVIIENKRNLAIKKLCNNGGNWLIDLPAKDAVAILRKIPRNCNYDHIWTTSNIEKYKANNYLNTVLAPIKQIKITDEQLLTYALKPFQL